MALSTKNIPVSSGNLSKSFKPGNVYAKLSGFTFERDNFSDDGLVLKLMLEGPDLGNNFEGFFIDPANQELGRHKGQIGNITASQYSFKDGSFGGRKIERDVEILKFISALGKALGKDEAVNELEAETIEAYIDLAAQVLVSETSWLYWTLGGREYEKGGYTNYSLFLVKNDYRQKKYAFGPAEEDVVKFDPEKHIVKKKKESVETVHEFEAPSTEDFTIPESGIDDDFTF